MRGQIRSAGCSARYQVALATGMQASSQRVCDSCLHVAFAFRDSAVAVRLAHQRFVAPSFDIAGVGPRAAVSKLSSHLANTQTSVWMESARLQAILGSCARSLPSLRSGISCYIAFAGAACACVCMAPSCILFCRRCATWAEIVLSTTY